MKKTGKILIGVLSVGALIGTGYAAWHINNGFVSTESGNVDVSVNDMIINSFAKVVVEETDTPKGLTFDGGLNEDLHLSYKVTAQKTNSKDTKDPYDLKLYENVAKEYIPDLKVTVKAYNKANSSSLTTEELAKVNKFINLPEEQTFAYTDWLSDRAGKSIALDFSWSKATFNGQNPEKYFKENPSETAETTIKEMIETLKPITFKVHFDVGQHTFTEPDKSGTITIPKIANSTLTIDDKQDKNITAGEHEIKIALDEGKQIKDNKLTVIENGVKKNVTLNETSVRAIGKIYTCTYNFLKDVTYSFEYTVENIPPRQVAIIEGTHDNVTFTTAEGEAINFETKVNVGSTFKFKATAVKGYELKEVKHNNETLTIKDGLYEFVVIDGTNTISATATKILPKQVTITEGTHTNVNLTTTAGTKIDYTAKHDVGSTFEFKATALEGYKLESVKHNETVLEAKGDVYSFKVVDGTNTISAIATEIPQNKLTVTGEKTVKVGKTTQLKLFLGEDEINKDITRESSDKNIASISETGLVTGVKEGEITIKATYNGDVLEHAMSVINDVDLTKPIKGTLKEASEAITGAKYDQTILYEVEGTVKDVEKADYGRMTITDGITDFKVYGSRIESEDNKSLSYVNGKWDYDYAKGIDPTPAAKVNMKVKMYVFGKDTGKYKNFYGVILNYEGTPATAIEITNKETTMKVNETLQLTTNLTPSTTTSDVVYETSNENIIAVSKDGELKAIAEGEAIITAKVSETVKDTITIKVSGETEALPTHVFVWSSGMGTIAPDKNSLTIENGDFTFQVLKNKSPNSPVNTFDELRIYQNHSFIVSSSTKKILKIEYTTVGSKNGAVKTNDAAKIANKGNSWTIIANDQSLGLSSIELLAQAQIRVQEITITYLN